MRSALSPRSIEVEKTVELSPGPGQVDTSDVSGAVPGLQIEQPASVQVQPLRRIFIANRGEAAVRDIRSIRDKYGAHAEIIVPYVSADESSYYVRLANRAILLDRHDKPADNFNDEAYLVQLAQESGADIFSVKWGFRAESSSLAAMVEATGMKFNGPSAEEMIKLGHKWHALEAAKAAGLPTGKYSPLLQSADETVEIEEKKFLR